MATRTVRLVAMQPNIHIIVGLFALAACRRGGPTSPGLTEGKSVPDFSLRDENPTSDHHGESLSPYDFECYASVWYFGHAT